MPVTTGDVDAIEARAAPAPRPGLPVLSHGLARAACHRAGAAGSKQHGPARRADAARGRQADFKEEQVTGAAAAKSPPANVPVDRMPANGGAALADAAARPEAESGQGAEVLDAEDSAALEALRNDVFMRGAIPWCVRPPGRAPTHARACSPARGPRSGTAQRRQERARARIVRPPRPGLGPPRCRTQPSAPAQVGGHGRLRRVCGAGRRLHPAAVPAAQVVHGAGGLWHGARIRRRQRVRRGRDRLGPGAPAPPAQGWRRILSRRPLSRRALERRRACSASWASSRLRPGAARRAAA